MAADTTAQQIDILAQTEVPLIAMLYGPHGLDGPNGPPVALVTALEQLETAVVDPTTLSGTQTVASIESQTLTDLQTLVTLTRNQLNLISQYAVGDEGAVEGAEYSREYPTDTTTLEQDSKSFLPPANPPQTIVQPLPPTNGLEQYLITDTTTGVTSWQTGQAYSGAIPAITNEYIAVTNDSLNITSTAPNNFIHGGAGNDGISVNVGFLGGTAGINILDGGGGSNFLIGSPIKGTNDFYLDDRNTTAPVESTVVNMHAGDSLTVWGVNATDFTTQVVDNAGAPGYTGVDIGIDKPNYPVANVIIAGYSSADLLNGNLDVSYGHVAGTATTPGIDYMLITAGPSALPSP